jgi:hypothetical protein
MPTYRDMTYGVFRHMSIATTLGSIDALAIWK